MTRIWLFLAASVTLSAQFNTHLSQATEEAFSDYLKPAEALMNWRPRFAEPQKLAKVEVVSTGKKGTIDIKDGLVHDWTAARFAPGATVEQVLKALQSYDLYKTIYSPEVIDSKLISHDGNQWHAYMRVLKKKVVTVVLDLEYAVEFKPLGDGRWAVISRSTKLTEVDSGKQLPPGEGHGFLWRLNAYWLLEPRPNGVYIECRTISLSRNIPTGLGWIVRPMVSSLPRESLTATIESTVRALKP